MKCVFIYERTTYWCQKKYPRSGICLLAGPKHFLTPMVLNLFFLCLILSHVVMAWSNMQFNSIYQSSVLVPDDCSIPAYEYLALYDLYDSTNGSGWAWRTTQNQWNFSGNSDPCLDSWEGLSCSSSSTSSTYHIDNINLTSYRMVGSIPSSIGVFSNLSILSIGENFLTNSIPSSVGNLTSLLRLALYQNKLNGTIPSTVGNLTNLKIMEMKNNSFTGSLPESFSALRNLVLLDVYLNQLTGTVPSFVSNMLQLQYLDIYENKYHGTIPSYLGNLHFLRYLYLGKNALTGTIPDMLANLQNLVSFYANTNKLAGTVPSSFSQLPNLQFLFLYENDLSGCLDKVFNSSVQKKMKNVILYDNNFTGNLPEQLFNISSVEVVDCSNNCLDGALPQTICASKSLKTLALDGMCAAPHCRNYLFPGLSTYILRNTLSNGIPQCLLELPQLETLHITGNGVTGSLPSNVTLSDTFTDLALSQNDITGELPLYIQTRKWSSLDLNNNRVGGTLSPDFVEQNSTAQLRLANNRLSGPIPEGITFATGPISVLDGNLFGCDYYKTDLPEEDKKRSTYECGSNTFNLSMYVWLCVAGVMAAALIIASLYTAGNYSTAFAACKIMCAVLISQSVFLDEWDLPGPDADGKPLKFQLLRYRRICDMFKLCRRLAIVVTAFIVCILLPLYSIVSISTSSLTYQYAYKVSIIYLSGKLTAGLAMALLLILLLSTFASFAFLLRKYQTDARKFVEEIHTVTVSETVPESEIVLESETENVPGNKNRKETEFVLQTVVSTAETISNEYNNVEKKNSFEKVIVYSALVAVDLIVVFWANIGFVYFVIYGSEDVLPFVQLALSLYKIIWGEVCSKVIYYLCVHVNFKTKNIGRAIVSLYAGITVFNNIVAPCLVVMAISTTCFYNLVIQPKDIKSSYEYLECAAYDVTGCYQFVMIPHESSFSPPFVYSYQCSASIITYYAPSFMYVCIISGFIIPVIRYLAFYLVRYVPRGWCVELLMVKNKLWWVLVKSLPLILRPINTENNPLPARNTPYFDARTQLVMIFNYLAVLLTFGAMFPPLAVALLVLIISTIFCARLEVKRFLKEATKKKLSKYIEIIDHNCSGFGSDRMLLRGGAGLVVICSCFYTLFIFDILGDEVKFKGAFWVLIVMPVFPISLVMLFMTYLAPKFVLHKMIRNSVNDSSKFMNDLRDAFSLEEGTTTSSPITRNINMHVEDEDDDKPVNFDEISY